LGSADLLSTIRRSSSKRQLLTTDDSYLLKILFSDKAIFHIHAAVNYQSCRIWDSENRHTVMEHVPDSPKVNVWCRIISDRIAGPCSFHESAIMSAVYLYVLENFVFPQTATEEFSALTVLGREVILF
jgi:hypothetical protein